VGLESANNLKILKNMSTTNEKAPIKPTLDKGGVISCYSGKIKGNKFVTEYAYKHGVFKNKRGKYITRVQVGKNKTLTTISQHNTQQDAIDAYNAFYNSL
jgi:hypothetical protein